MLNYHPHTTVGIVPLPLKIWWEWLKKTPFSLKWLVLIILFKPVIDAFYFVKNTGIVSPTQLVGFLSFLFCLLFILGKKQKDKVSIRTILFLFFAFLLLLNAFFVHLLHIDINGAGEFIRISLPLFLFFYLKNELRDLDDINGILMSFILSSIFPYLIYLYEFFFAPIQIVEISEGRGGGLRLTGIYADMFNYMAYIIGDFLIILLYFANRLYTKIKPSYYLLFGIFVLTFIGLSGIKHQASWGVFFVISLLFLLSIVTSKQGLITIVLISFVSLFLLPVIWQNTIAPLYTKEIRAYNNKLYQQQALNGRVMRWKKYFAIWDEMSLEAKLFGVGFSNHPSAAIMMSGGMHSDYVRFLFSTGIIGFLCYVSTLLLIILKSFLLPLPIRFFVLSACAIFLFYAISSNPFGASGALMYIGILGLVLAEKPLHFFLES